MQQHEDFPAGVVARHLPLLVTVGDEALRVIRVELKRALFLGIEPRGPLLRCSRFRALAANHFTGTLGRNLAAQARADLIAVTPGLIKAIRHQSGQSRKIEAILMSLWNDEHPVNLCDGLAGLDPMLAQAAVAMIAGRAHMGGDADGLLRDIIQAGDSHQKDPDEIQLNRRSFPCNS